MKTLFVGSSGLLGQHLKIKADRPSHEELDITKPIIPGKYDLVIHAVAYTDVAKAEIDRLECFRVNVYGTYNLMNAYKDTPFVYISSEYAHNPVNFYSLTKSLAEQLFTTFKFEDFTNHPSYLIIRTLFKPNPYPYDYAFNDQWTQGDTVDVIAPLIEKEIEEWDRKSKMVYVGTGRKTMYELAKKTNPNVLPNSIKDMKVRLPSDYAE